MTWDEMAAAYRAGRLEDSAQIGAQLLAHDPENAEVIHLLGVIAYRKRELGQALECMERVLAIDPWHLQALNGAATVLGETGRAAEALPLCLRAIEIRPADARAHNTLGLCHLALGGPAEATAAFRQALALDPSLAVARENLKIALGRLEGQGQASREADELEARGFQLLSERRRVEAVQAFTKAVEREPHSVPRRLRLADAQRQQGEVHAAVSVLRRAVAQDSESAAAFCMLGYALQDLGSFEEAVTAFQRSISLQIRQGDAHLGLATSRPVESADAEWVDRMEALATDPNLPPSERVFLQTARSKAADDLGQYEKAMACMDEANRIALSDTGMRLRFDPTAFERRVDETLAVVTAESVAAQIGMGLESEMPIWIVGLPRSGTSLVEQILAAHPDVAAGGELRYWSDVDAMRIGGLDGIFGDPHEATRVAGAYLEALRDIGPEAARVTDKMPVNFMYVGHLHALFPKGRFIHCRRSPLDNCVSLYMTPFRQRPPICYRRADIVAYYRQYARLMDAWRQLLPADAMLELDYEEVVERPEDAARQIVAFSGLRWDDSCLRPHEVERALTTASRWQARQPVYRHSVGRWRRYMPWLGEFRELLSNP